MSARDKSLFKSDGSMNEDMELKPSSSTEPLKRKPKLRDSQPDVSPQQSKEDQAAEDKNNTPASQETAKSQMEIHKDELVLNELNTSETFIRLAEVLTTLEEDVTGFELDEDDKEKLFIDLSELKSLASEIPNETLEHQQTAAKLRQELKNAWVIIDAERERDLKQQDSISSMRYEMQSLRDELEKLKITRAPTLPNGAEMQMMQEEKMMELMASKSLLEDKLAKAEERHQNLMYDLDQLSSKLSAEVMEKTSLDIELQALKEILSTKKSEIDREARAKEKAEIALKQANETLAKKDSEMQMKLAEVKQLKEQIALYENMIRDEKAKTDRLEHEKDTLSNKLSRVQQDYEEQVITVTRLLTENQRHQSALHEREEKLQAANEENRGLQRLREALNRKYKTLEESKEEVDLDRETLRAQVQTQAKQMEDLNKVIESLNRQVEVTARERDLAQKNIAKATTQTQKQIGLAKVADQNVKNLEQEITGYKEEAAKMRKLIFSLEKDRDRLLLENNKNGEEKMELTEKLRIFQITLSDSRKKVQDFEKKLKEQEAMYESVRADRNLYSKNFIESQDESGELKKKLKLMGHQIDQLKEEISAKNVELNKNNLDQTKLEKDKESLTIQIGKLHHQLEEANRELKTQRAEENKLRHTINEGDAERQRIQKLYAVVIQERDVIGTQLIRKNDEISLLYEKIRIQTSALHKGEIQYRERLEDIRVLKLEIKRLRRERAILQTETHSLNDLKNEIFKIQKDLLQERTKVKVLEEELESPMNVHRWRKLAGSDPSTYELIKKVQMLQKRLISKTEDVVEKELVISQKEKMYKELKALIQRQPGPEVLEELRSVKEAVKSKVRECKSLASELNMYHSQINEYKFEIERITREQQELKKKYYESKKKGSKKIYAFPSKILEDVGKIPKYMGGGYKMPDKTMPNAKFAGTIQS